MAEQKSGSDNQEFVWLAVMIVVGGIVWAIWTFARDIVVRAAFALDLVQVTIVSLFMGLGERGHAYRDYMLGTFDGRYDPNHVSWAALVEISTAVGMTMRWPLTLLILAMAVITIYKMKGSGFSRKFSLVGGKGKGPSLALYQAQEWKSTLPSALFNPNEDDPKQAPAKTPPEWLRDGGIALDEKQGLDRDAAERAFQEQLGDPWPGLDKAPTHVRVMAVLCALKAKRDKEMIRVRDEISIAYTTKPGSADRIAEKLIAPYVKDPKIRKAIDKYASKHAYTTTALYRLLMWGRRKGGVFGCGEFRWLKPIDRTLWYGLNNCGRRAYHIEGAGIVAHYMVEFLGAKPRPTPAVERAVEGLEEYLQTHYITNLETVFHVENDF